jgi:predicted outer membrane protein
VTGTSFDRAFAQAMQKDHQKAIAIVEASRQRIDDPKLEALLDQLQATLRAHEQIASNMLAADPCDRGDPASS